MRLAMPTGQSCASDLRSEAKTTPQCRRGARCYIHSTMTKLLEDGIEAIRRLPEDRQDLAGEMLLAIAGRDDQPRNRPTDEQIVSIRQGVAEADAGLLFQTKAWRHCSIVSDIAAPPSACRATAAPSHPIVMRGLDPRISAETVQLFGDPRVKRGDDEIVP